MLLVWLVVVGLGIVYFLFFGQPVKDEKKRTTDKKTDKESGTEKGSYALVVEQAKVLAQQKRPQGEFPSLAVLTLDDEDAAVDRALEKAASFLEGFDNKRAGEEILCLRGR